MWLQVYSIFGLSVLHQFRLNGKEGNVYGVDLEFVRGCFSELFEFFCFSGEVEFPIFYFFKEGLMRDGIKISHLSLNVIVKKCILSKEIWWSKTVNLDKVWQLFVVANALHLLNCFFLVLWTLQIILLLDSLCFLKIPFSVLLGVQLFIFWFRQRTIPEFTFSYGWLRTGFSQGFTPIGSFKILFLAYWAASEVFIRLWWFFCVWTIAYLWSRVLGFLDIDGLLILDWLIDVLRYSFDGFVIAGRWSTAHLSQLILFFYFIQQPGDL